jgi:hypothetical protein
MIKLVVAMHDPAVLRRLAHILHVVSIVGWFSIILFVVFWSPFAIMIAAVVGVLGGVLAGQCRQMIFEIEWKKMTDSWEI